SRILLEAILSTGGSRLGYVAATMLVAPGIIATQVMAHNGLAVLFPAWVSIGPSRGMQGTEVMGQRLIVMAGMLLVLVMAVPPAAAVAGIAALGLSFLTGRLWVVIPALLASAILVAECLLASEAIGHVLDRTDIAALDAIE